MMEHLAIKCKLDDGAFLPEKAYDTDAGFDLRTPRPAFVPAKGSVLIDTGVHVLIPPGYCGFLKSKSGLNMRAGLRAEGVIDSGYTGSVVVKMYNDSDGDHTFIAGDKVTQIVFLPIPEVKLEVVSEIEEKTDRGAGGFGSTGR